MNRYYLTNEEKACVKTLNAVAKFDGIIQSDDDIEYILESLIEKLIAPKRQHLVYVNRNVYPIRISIRKQHESKPV